MFTFTGIPNQGNLVGFSIAANLARWTCRWIETSSERWRVRH
jgi:hypothetical protein